MVMLSGEAVEAEIVCEICKHPLRPKIDRMLLENRGYQEIVKTISLEYPEAPVVVFHLKEHWRKHLALARRVAVDSLVQQNATDLYDSLKLTTYLIDEWIDTYRQVIANTDWTNAADKGILLSAQKNGMALIKLNADLKGDVKESRNLFDLADISSLRDEVKKYRKKVKASDSS